MFGRLREFVVAAALLAPSTGLAQVQVNQTFTPQGPAPKSGLINLVQSADAPPGGTVSGAVQSILLDPALGSQTMFVGAVNGGIWRTTNGGATWAPLTDRQGSLSIASMALDPSDPSVRAHGAPLFDQWRQYLVLDRRRSDRPERDRRCSGGQHDSRGNV